MIDLTKLEKTGKNDLGVIRHQKIIKEVKESSVISDLELEVKNYAREFEDLEKKKLLLLEKLNNHKEDLDRLKTRAKRQEDRLNKAKADKKLPQNYLDNLYAAIFDAQEDSVDKEDDIKKTQQKIIEIEQDEVRVSNQSEKAKDKLDKEKDKFKRDKQKDFESALSDAEKVAKHLKYKEVRFYGENVDSYEFILIKE